MIQIGDLASRAGVSTRTIRYYEELGMIVPRARSNGGFRRYGEDQLRRLEIIQSLKALGFELERIRELFCLRDNVETGAELANAMVGLLESQQEEIDRKVSHYMDMRESAARGIEILRACLGCEEKILERNCDACGVYQKQEDVPDLLQCTIYDG